MNANLKYLIAGALLSACTVSVVSNLQAQTVNVSETVAGPVQYRIVTAGSAPDGKTLEAELNRLAVEGWRVRTSVMAGVVMEKQ